MSLTLNYQETDSVGIVVVVVHIGSRKGGKFVDEAGGNARWDAYDETQISVVRWARGDFDFIVLALPDVRHVLFTQF